MKMLFEENVHQQSHSYTHTLKIAIIMESFLAFEITIIVKFCELSLCQDLCA
jgi:hypothetical protein